MASKLITYGTEVVYKGKTIYYSHFSFRSGMHLCYFSMPDSFFPKHIYLNRKDFVIKRELKDTFKELGQALL